MKTDFADGILVCAVLFGEETGKNIISFVQFSTLNMLLRRGQKLSYFILQYKYEVIRLFWFCNVNSMDKVTRFGQKFTLST